MDKRIGVRRTWIRTSWKSTVLAVAVSGWLLLFIWVGWVGYIGSDDWVYILNARARMDDPLLIGTNHWQVRLTFTLPLAVSFALLGESELAAALPTLTYLWLTILALFVFLLPRFGKAPAVLAALLVSSSPILIVNATSLRVDTVETFYVVVSVLVLLIALERRGGVRLLMLSGMLAGLAFLTRPTSVALVIFFCLVAVFDADKLGRRNYWPLFVGFFVTWLIEALYYFLNTGSLFYRLGIDFNHDTVERAGTVFVSVLIAPLKMLLTSHGFGLAFVLLPVFAWVLIRSSASQRMINESHQRVLFVLGFVVAWICVFSAFASKLVLDPRYMAPALTFALMVSAVAIEKISRHGRKVTAAGLLSAMFLFHLLGLSLENKSFLYAERWLVRLATVSQEPIYTDPQTRERAMFLIQLNKVESRIVAEPAPAGALFLSVPRNIARGRYNKESWSPSDYDSVGWPVVETLAPGMTFLGKMLQPLRVEHLVGSTAWSKLSEPNPAVHLKRNVQYVTQ